MGQLCYYQVIFLLLFLTVIYMFSELVMKRDTDFTNYKVITVSLME